MASAGERTATGTYRHHCAALQANAPVPQQQQHPSDALIARLIAQRAALVQQPGENDMKPAKLIKFRGDGSQNFHEWLVDYLLTPGNFSVSVLLSYMDGPAKARLAFYIGQGGQLTHDSLLSQLGQDYYDHSQAAKARASLTALRQGKLSISEYTRQFIQLATLAGALNDANIVMRYFAGVSDSVYSVARRLGVLLKPLPEAIRLVTEEVHKQEGYTVQRQALQAAAAGMGAAAEAAVPQGPMPMELGYMLGRRMPGAEPQPRDGKCHACGRYGHWAKDVHLWRA
jgi:hypothetical protein